MITCLGQYWESLVLALLTSLSFMSTDEISTSSMVLGGHVDTAPSTMRTSRRTMMVQLFSFGSNSRFARSCTSASLPHHSFSGLSSNATLGPSHGVHQRAAHCLVSKGLTLGLFPRQAHGQAHAISPLSSVTCQFRNKIGRTAPACPTIHFLSCTDTLCPDVSCRSH